MLEVPQPHTAVMSSRTPSSGTALLPCRTTPGRREGRGCILVKLFLRGIPPSTPYCSEYYIKLERNSTPAFIYHCAYGPMAVAGDQVCCQAGQVCSHPSSTAVSRSGWVRAVLLCLASWRAPREALALRWSPAKDGTRYPQCHPRPAAPSRARAA